MSMFRSEDMDYCRVVLPRESAWETLNELGKIDCIHQIDNEQHLPNISRPFYNQIKRCDEVEYMLFEINQQINKYEENVQKCQDIKELVDVTFPKFLNSRQRAGRTYFDEIENEVLRKHSNLKDQVQNLDNMLEKQKQLEEYKQVLQKSQEIMGPDFFSGQPGNYGDERIDIHGKGIEEIKSELSSNLNKVSGIIDSNDTNRFQKVVFRITKGNCWIAFKNVEESTENGSQKRSVFVLVFPGHRNGLAFSKISRICESFNANRFQIPQSQQEFSYKIQQIQQQLVESKQVNNINQFNYLTQRQLHPLK